MFTSESNAAYDRLDAAQSELESAKGLFTRTVDGLRGELDRLLRDRRQSLQPASKSIAEELATLRGSRCTLVRQSDNVAEVLSEDEVARIVLKHLGG